MNLKKEKIKKRGFNKLTITSLPLSLSPPHIPTNFSHACRNLLTPFSLNFSPFHFYKTPFILSKRDTENPPEIPPFTFSSQTPSSFSQSPNFFFPTHYTTTPDRDHHLHHGSLQTTTNSGGTISHHQRPLPETNQIGSILDGHSNTSIHAPTYQAKQNRSTPDQPHPGLIHITANGSETPILQPPLSLNRITTKAKATDPSPPSQTHCRNFTIARSPPISTSPGHYNPPRRQTFEVCSQTKHPRIVKLS